MYCEGVPQYKIAEALDVCKQQISYDMQLLIKRWQKESTRKLSVWKARELEKINHLEATYWTAYAASRDDKSTVSKSQRVGQEVVTNSQKAESPSGDPRFLQGVERCIERRCKLLGLDKPIQVESTGVKVDYQSLTTPQLLARRNGMSWDEVLAMEPDNGS